MKRRSKSEIDDMVRNTSDLPFERAAAFDQQTEPTPDVWHPIMREGEYFMPHAVKYLNEREFKARVARERMRPSSMKNTALFSHGDATNEKVRMIVGDEAQSGVIVRKIGAEKYEESYFKRLVMAALLRLFPDGNDNVILSFGHSSDNIGVVDGVGQFLKGWHTVTRGDGRDVKYRIRVSVSWDEPAGGIWRWIERQGSWNAVGLSVGQKIAVIDIGGGVSSIYPVVMETPTEPNIQWSQGRPFGMGVLDIMRMLEEELKALHEDVFLKRSIPESILNECLRRQGWCTVKGEQVDCTQAYLNATAPLLDGIQAVYNGPGFDGGLDVTLNVVTGGGGGLLFKPLMETLRHNYIYLADDPETIAFANLRGGVAGTRAWLADNPRAAALGASIVIVDLGNSGFKLTLLAA